MDECKPLPVSSSVWMRRDWNIAVKSSELKECTSDAQAARQGPTLVYFSAQRKRFLWDRGCIWGLFMGRLVGTGGCQGGHRVYFVSETAHVEPKSGRV